MGKQALALLKESLNREIDTVQSEWVSLDGQLGYRTIDVEHVDRENFYHGHRPSLIDAPVERYPNCSVLAYSSSPSPESAPGDHVNRYTVSLAVELMCKALGDDAEGLVNSRTQRTVDAAHRVLMRERTLRGLISELGEAPTVLLTDVFVRPEKSGHGPRFLWQGARLEYPVLKYARIES